MNFIASFLSSAASKGEQQVGSGSNFSSNQAQVGGDSSEDAKASFGYSLLRGKRNNMEDFHHAQFRKVERTGQVVGFFGVFDGHGGPAAASFVKAHLFETLLRNENFASDMHMAIKQAYEVTDEEYLNQENTNQKDDGCTAVTGLLIGNKLFIANVGDSRAVLSRGGKAIALSIDHKPNRPEERERIENAGGVVVWAGTWRVGGVLAVSRAFGDRPLKKYVVPTPDIRTEVITGEDEFVIFASDGLWDVMSNQEAITLVRDISDAQKAARKLSDEAFVRGSNDNISCIIVRFHR